MVAEVRIPSLLKIGGGSVSQVPSILRSLGCGRPLIVTDSFFMSQGQPSHLKQRIELEVISCEVFSGAIPDPNIDSVTQGLTAYINGQHDSIVSLGGGSSIDTAKAIGLLATNEGQLRDYVVPNQIPRCGPPHIAIPTTAGTGSEVTRFTVITDVEREEKMLIAGWQIMASAAVIDYELTMSMPPRLTADTGTDSLTHAIEAYVSRRANPFTDAFALSAMGKIWTALPRVFQYPEDRNARKEMMLAATLAGIAFSNASVALVHGMSRPIGGFFHVPHGLANAMLLPAVTEFSAPAAIIRYADCAFAMGIASAGTPAEEAVRHLIDALYARNSELQVPSPRQYGISQDAYRKAIPTMAQQALASGSPANNPRIPSAEEIERLYEQAWN